MDIGRSQTAARGMLCAMALLTPVVGEAATYYVATTGSDSNSCAQGMSASTPKQTISAGIPCLVAGDTLIIKDGTYAESLTNSFTNTGNSWAEKITVKAENNKAVTLQPGIPGAILWHDDAFQKYIEYDGLVLDGKNTSGYGLGIWSFSNHIRFQNGAILNARDQGVSVLKDAGGNPQSNEFINLEVAYTGYNVSCTPGYCHAFYIGGDNNLIDRVDMHHNNGYGPHFYPGDNFRNIVQNSASHDNWAGLVSAGDSNQILNNQIYDNANGGMLIFGTNNLIDNNTVFNNPGGSGGMTIDGSGHVVTNNVFSQNGVYGISLDSSNRIVNPEPASAGLLGSGVVGLIAWRYYHLRSGSRVRV